jgi:hypothetical protein
MIAGEGCPPERRSREGGPVHSLNELRLASQASSPAVEVVHRSFEGVKVDRHVRSLRLASQSRSLTVEGCPQ